MKVILGTGQLGLEILSLLLKNDPSEEITLVNRTGTLNEILPDNVQLLAADVTNKHQMECIARDAEVIFSCTDVPYERWSAFYPATAEAMGHALSKTTARLVFADNLYSYGNTSGAVMVENLRHNALTKKGKIRSAVIQRLLYSGEAFNDRVAIVKAADFIGPRIHKGLFGVDFLNRLNARKTIFLFGEPQWSHTFTYISDFAEAMVKIGNAQDTFGQIWHVPNAPAINLYAWIKLFEQKTGKRARVKVMPKWVVRLAGFFDPLLREMYELAYQFEFPYLIDHTKYVSRFGNHATSPASIVAQTVDWYSEVVASESQSA